MDVYPLFEARGNPRQLGCRHGEQARGRIQGYWAYLSESLKLTAAQLETRALRFQPLFATHCPHLLEEVRGLAEGAAISEAAALGLQLRGELVALPDGACTTFVIAPRQTLAGEVLIRQTSDTPAEIEEFGYVLRVVPAKGPRVLMWTFGGMLGYHGLGEHGVAHFANALGGGPAWNMGLSHYPLKRLLLAQQSLDDCLTLMREFPVCSSGNYVLCDGQGEIADVELTNQGPQVIRDDGSGFLAHSNHFLCGPLACAENHQLSLPDSFPRLDRMRDFLSQYAGRLDAARLKEILADHAGHPVSICRHPHVGVGDAILPSAGKTVAGLIAEPARGLLHVCRGNPCSQRFETYGLFD